MKPKTNQQQLADEYRRTVRSRVDDCACGRPFEPDNAVYSRGRDGKIRRFCRHCHNEASLRTYHTRKALTAPGP